MMMGMNEVNRIDFFLTEVGYEYNLDFFYLVINFPFANDFLLTMLARGGKK